MKKKNLIYSISPVLLLITIIGCSGITKVTDVITNPSAREIYAREFKNNELLYDEWDAAYQHAFNDSLEITLPYGEKGTFNAGFPSAFSYTLSLQEGEVLQAEVIKDEVHQRIFIDLFEYDGLNYRKIESSGIEASAIAIKAQKTGSYKIIIQPELTADSRFFISLNKRSLYTVFPVAGKGNAAIGSFWGQERDGGKRSHEGIDIFAKKGTPVLAATHGYITYTGERGIGGKQVWLRDQDFGGSLYYAHLDGIAVNSGNRVQAGDTLGFVGNTGNARFTPPHLHFGIYRGYGAVNPLPFVYRTDLVVPEAFPKTFRSSRLRITTSMANLRQGPATAADKIGQLKINDEVMLLGQNKEWLHIQTPSRQKAFLHKSLVREIK